MRNDNVIRVDFKNKQRFGDLALVKPSTQLDALQQANKELEKIHVVDDVFKNCESAQFSAADSHEADEVKNVDKNMVALSNDQLDAMINALMFYSNIMGFPGWDGGKRANIALSTLSI